jgi:hypothetical protein
MKNKISDSFAIFASFAVESLFGGVLIADG